MKIKTKTTFADGIYIGMMSGTSMDGIDAVCVNYADGAWDKIIAHCHLPYPDDFKKSLLAMQQPQFDELHQFQILGAELARYSKEVVEQLLQDTGLSASQIEAIGCHGQTIRHRPENHYSLQLMNWALLAELTRIPVVGDFRSGDLAAGGQGAPLVPLFHQLLFADPVDTRVILNIGGISNITILRPGEPARGFDTGPGNMLLDSWMNYSWGKAYDHDGEFSGRGRVILDLLQELYNKTVFFLQPLPKSTGRDLFSLDWLKGFAIDEHDPYDLLATLLELSSFSIAEEILKYAADAKEILVCGGGVYNKTLLKSIKARLAPRTVKTTEALGINPLHVEAAAFSWLAWRRLRHECGNVPEVTGAAASRVLGAVWRPFGGGPQQDPSAT